MPPAPSRIALAALAALPLLSAGCESCVQPRRDPPVTAPTASVVAPPEPPPPARTLLDLVRELPNCDIDHRGPLLDVGTDATTGRFGWSSPTPKGLVKIEHDGSTWARFTERGFDLTFTLTERTPVFVAARAIGYAARGVTVALDDQPLGTLTLTHQQIKIATTPATTLPVDPGLHTLSFRFTGRAQGGETFADFDWIRVGIPDDSAATYGPPTQRDVVAPAAAIGGVPHKSLALRAPGSLRCTLRLPQGAHLRSAIGVQGQGEGEAEIRILRDGQKPEVIRTVRVEGGDKAVWNYVDLPLDAFAGGVAALELGAASAPKGGRILFGDPVIALPSAPPPPVPRARAVILVVLDGVERSELPPWNPAPAALPTLSELAGAATVFDRHRAPTTVVAAVAASLLTGQPPETHGLGDAAARLPAGETTVASVARDASVRSAMFTGVPFTFRAFGFAGGWERFVETPPQSGEPATAPLDQAAAWVTEIARGAGDARMLAVVHARGGHPPWDVTAKELGAAQPTDYTGLVEPRRGAQVLAKMRRSKRANVITDADRARIQALAQISLAGQDRALGALIAALKSAGLWDQTLFVVTGDVASAASALYADAVDLDETALSLPLYVHFPGGAHAGRRVTEPTEIIDLPATALAALGLSFAKPPAGRDLAKIASGLADAPSTPQVATLFGTYAARWGDLVLIGRWPKPPQLCDLAVDPTCAFNRREAMPLAASAIFRRVATQELATRAPASKREPATIDTETWSSLSVWGAVEAQER